MKSGKKLRDKYGNKNRLINLCSRMVNEFFCLTSVISPSLNTRLRYRYNFSSKLNLRNPQTFIEKCNWYKLRVVNKNKIYRDCSDKFLVRNFVTDHGCAEYLNELICVFDSVEEISWDQLPNSFAMKLNDGCGYYIICNDKNKLNIEESKRKLKKWWSAHNYLLYSEMQNKAKRRVIIVEKYIEGTVYHKQPIDYKIYCFNGKPTAILVVWDRQSEHKKVFMSPNWEFISYVYKSGYCEKCDAIPSRPKHLDQMLDCAQKLSKPFAFVRVDMYQGKAGPLFGELTFTAAGAMFTAQTDPYVLDMSKCFSIPDIL